VKLSLDRNWGNGSSVLGATIRLEAFGDAHNNILAVKDVLLNGPAREAGFIPFSDFIIGTREIAFKSLEEFAKYVEVNKGQEIRLWIYNIETESVREVPLTPNN
jgi:C-terminal processing protease CtpA/Prc